MADIEPSTQPPRKLWEGIDRAIVIAGVFISGTVCFINWQSEHAKLRLEYLRLSISILQSDTKNADGSASLRSWAVQILQDPASQAKLTTEQIKLLESGSANLPKKAGYYDYYEGDLTPEMMKEGEEYFKSHGGYNECSESGCKKSKQ